MEISEDVGMYVEKTKNAPYACRSSNRLISGVSGTVKVQNVKIEPFRATTATTIATVTIYYCNCL